MYKSIIQFLVAVVLSGFAAACTQPGGRPRPDAPDSVSVVALYRYFYDGDSAAVMAHPRLAEDFLRVVDFPTDDLSAGASMWSNSLPVRVFTPAVDSIYGHDGPHLDSYVGYALAAARLEGIALPERDYAAVVYGRREAIGFSDSVMYIALNHYIDPDYPGYQRFPVYERVVKTPAQLPYDIAEALVGSQLPYQAPSDGGTALSHMLYEGALACARTALVENADEAEALGYSERQYEWVLDHEAELWRELISRELLYDTDETAWRRLVSPAPVTSVLSIYSPGRAGRFLGYRMVKRYLEAHPEADLASLLSPEFYNAPDVLEKIDYNP